MAASISLKDMVDATFLDQGEEWPDNAALFQFLEKSQMLLPDQANCLSCRAFLALCNLKVEVVTRVNADKMSPSGRVPFLHVGSQIIAEFEPIVQFVQSNYVNLDDSLADAEQLSLTAYSSLVFNTLTAAELYFTWAVDENAEMSTSRFSSPFPWPLNKLLPWIERRKVLAQLQSLGFDTDANDVLRRYEEALNALEQQLGSQQYFFGNSPSSLDALVCGHVIAVVRTRLPDDRLSVALNKHPSLVQHSQRINAMF